MAKPLFDTLFEEGLLEYGCVIAVSHIHALLGIEVPETGTMKEFRDIALKEVAAIDLVRDRLLDHGKYLKLDGGAYRILLPSENMGRVREYQLSAKRKLSRAERLSRSTPAENKPINDQSEARSHLMQSVRSFGGAVAGRKRGAAAANDEREAGRTQKA